MSQSNTPRYVLCLNGGRIINRRMAIYIEGVRSNGLAVRILAVPRGPWVLNKSEHHTTPDRVGSMSVDLGPVSSASLTSIMCFHWSVLPIAVILGLIRRVPVLYDEYDHFELNALEGERSRIKNFLFNFAVRWIHRLCLPWVTLVTCIHMQHSALKAHLQHWQPNVLEIHNYPAAVWRQSGQQQSTAGKLCFVYIGGVYVEKGCKAAADAFQMLPEAIRSQCELHIFGEGDPHLIAALRTQPGVTVHNGVAPSQFRHFAATHRCCGLALLAGTTRYNMVGTNCTKLYEYLALGLPVIGTRVGEFPDWIEGHQLGLLIDPDLNTGQLTAQMQQLADNPQLFAQFSRNAATLMASVEMTWEHEWSRIEQTGIVDRSRKAA